MKLRNFTSTCIVCAIGLAWLPISAFAQKNFSQLILNASTNIKNERSRIIELLEQLSESVDVNSDLAKAKDHLNRTRLQIETGGVISSLQEQAKKSELDLNNNQKLLSAETYIKAKALLDIKDKELTALILAQESLKIMIDSLETKIINWQADYRVIKGLDAQGANKIINKFITEYLPLVKASYVVATTNNFSEATVINKQPLALPSPPRKTPSSVATTTPAMKRDANFEEGSANLFDINNVDQRPTPRAQPQPAYPYELSRAGISGDVVVEFIISENGDVIDTSIVRSSHHDFELPALQAVQQWKFKSGRKGGKAVKVRVSQLIEFNLEDSK
jgi:TonB family protein